MGIVDKFRKKKKEYSSPADQRARRTIENKFWKCPQCGSILRKGMAEWFGPGARIIGTATCGKCRAKFSQQDIYDGKYDVTVQVSTEKPSTPCPFLDSTGNCVPPGDPEQASPCSFKGDSYEFDCYVFPILMAKKVQLEEKETR